jgi:transcriptional regulator with AAA-type ATPase domain
MATKHIFQIVHEYVENALNISDLQPPRVDQDLVSKDLTFYLFQKKKDDKKQGVSIEDLYHKLESQLSSNVCFDFFCNIH